MSHEIPRKPQGSLFAEVFDRVIILNNIFKTSAFAVDEDAPLTSTFNLLIEQAEADRKKSLPGLRHLFARRRLALSPDMTKAKGKLSDLLSQATADRDLLTGAMMIAYVGRKYGEQAGTLKGRNWDNDINILDELENIATNREQTAQHCLDFISGKVAALEL